MARRKRFNDFMLLASGESVQSPSTAYQIEGVAGTGAFGAVYIARDPAKPGRSVALKEFFPPSHPRDLKLQAELFEREVYVGGQASSHPLMPTFYEAFDFDARHYIAQEFIHGETLETIIVRRHPLPREWILKWSVSLCDALAFLHERKIVHHDLKPANIRISPQGHLTLLDFGAAQYFEVGGNERKQVDLYGTVGYLPPEIDADGKWIADARTDVFSLGCIIYEMIAGEPPDQDQINERSMYVTNSLIQRPNADLNLVKLINKALSYNTDFRYGGAHDFLAELRYIAPPVLLVNRKHLRFGAILPGGVPESQSVSLYNAGGGTLRGEIKPRSSWLSVSVSSFQENEKTVAVSIIPARIDQKDILTTGKLEINSTDIFDDDGNVSIAGDRWFIECSCVVESAPGIIILEVAEGDGLPVLQVGTKANGSMGLVLRNTGGRSAEVSLELRPESAKVQVAPIELRPSVLVIPAGGSAEVHALTSPDIGSIGRAEYAALMVSTTDHGRSEHRLRLQYSDSSGRPGLGSKLKGLFGRKK